MPSTASHLLKSCHVQGHGTKTPWIREAHSLMGEGGKHRVSCKENKIK